MPNCSQWVLACEGHPIDEESFAAMSLAEQDWWLGTVRHLWQRFLGSAF